MKLPLWTIIPATWIGGFFIYAAYSNDIYPMSLNYYLTYSSIVSVIILGINYFGDKFKLKQ